jgi:hypothetical protein|tara:strand:+ start:2457 stop:3059 length:603 start_codon:yes stop_codon:yes gene_type:complete
MKTAKWAATAAVIAAFVPAAMAGVVRVNGDNSWSVFVNGALADEGADWQVATISQFDEGGAATLAIHVHDAEPGAAGVGGMLADVVLDDGTYIDTQDPRWLCDAGPVLADRSDGWETPGFDDSSWSAPDTFDQFGGGVWGFGAATMAATLNNPDSASYWSWCGPNDVEDEVYFRIVIGGGTAVDPAGKAATRWASIKSGR